MMMSGAAKKELKKLAKIESGHSVELVRVESGQAMQVRLASMGLVPGTTFTVVRNDHRGPFIIGLKGARVVLGRGMADRIEVRQ